MNQKFSNEEFFILQRMIDGDEIAFKYFFDTYYDDLCNFVNGYLRDETFSEDVIQNIFIYLWEKKDSLPFNCSIKSYLYTCLLYTSDAADEEDSVDLGGRRIIKK